MAPTALPQDAQQDDRLRSRLMMAQVISYGLIGIFGAVFLFLLLLDDRSFWLPWSRLLLAGALLALAVAENSLRCIGFTPPAAGQPDGGRRRLLPPFAARLLGWLRNLQLNLALTCAAALLALWLCIGNLGESGQLIPVEGQRLVISALLIAACFALLVAERMLSFRPSRHGPYQAEYTGLLRAALSIALLASAALWLSTASMTLALWLIKLASLIALLIALEFLLRVAIALTHPQPAGQPPYFVTRSSLAAQYRWPLHPLRGVQEKIRQQFGVDIGELQAFRLMGKTFLPVACGIALLGWLVSGLTEVPLHQRGIYERFGRPTAVLQPGLHYGLPWPFGRVLAVENGAVHELQLSEMTDDSVADAPPDSAEGPAPQSSWRLWDNQHVTDQSQVIAGTAADKQSFQIVNMDIRLIWRVGLNDRDALASVYQTDQLPLVIRSIARQQLVAHFASKQLDELLSEQRVTLASELNQQIQQRLDALHTGVELLFTRIEAIHPPAGAADAYHGVQAAQIAAGALIVRERGYAAQQQNDASRIAAAAIDNARAFASENLSRARAAATQFAAEHDAFLQAGDAFVTERRYHIFSQALARAPLLIIDSRLQGVNQPVLDLRQYSSPIDSTVLPKVAAK